jgi:hypothetical protein
MPAGDDVAPPAARRRLLERGDLPGSDGGLFNPGAWLDGDRLVLVVRREIDTRGSAVVHAERVVLDAATLALRSHNTLARRGFPDGARLEDFRPLRFRGETLCVHTLVHAGTIRPVLSRVTDDAIVSLGPLALPVATSRIEKNWVLFEHEGELHCLYRLDPLTILVRGARGRWRVRKRADNGWGDRFRGMLSNSANLVPFDGGHLGFWHSIVDGRYVQGALLLDDRLDIACATGVLLDGRDAAPALKPGVLYVSALVVHGGRVLAFYGEGDAHSGVAVYDAAALAAALRRSAFAPARARTVHLDPRTMGELFHAMARLERVAARGAHALWAHVPNPQLHEVVRRFGVRGLSLRDLAHRRRFDHDVGSLLAE